MKIRKNLELKVGGKRIVIGGVKEVRGLGVVKGLMFSKKENSSPLLFNIKSSLHSFFVSFDFLVLWLDESNNVVDKKIVNPFRFHVNSSKNYAKILEIPINRRYSKVVKLVVGEFRKV